MLLLRLLVMYTVLLPTKDVPFCHSASAAVAPAQPMPQHPTRRHLAHRTSAPPTRRFHVFDGPMVEPDSHSTEKVDDLVYQSIAHPSNPPSLISRFYRSWLAQPVGAHSTPHHGGQGAVQVTVYAYRDRVGVVALLANP